MRLLSLLERVARTNGELREVLDGTLEEILKPLGHRAKHPEAPDLGNPTLPEVQHVLEVLANQLGRVGDRALGIDRTRRFRSAGSGDRSPVRCPTRVSSTAEVGATHRVVDRVDPDEVDRGAPRNGVLVGQNESTPLVHVQLQVDRAVLLQREQMVVGIHDLGSPRAPGSSRP